MRRTLQQWQFYLESLDPAKIELGLERTRKVFRRLDLKISSKIVVVAGTNGKGSTVAALQSLLLSEDKTVGAYVSPHLQTFNERICFQGIPVTDDELIEAFERVEHVRDTTDLTYFEFTTLAAIQLLSHKNPDYMIFEVGLGGRLDAVNILDADIAIVTGVAMDHTDWLGDDLESIGYEKAGVYRTGRPAIYASQNCPETVLAQISRIDARPYVLGKQLSIEPLVAGEDIARDWVLTIHANSQTYSVDLHDQSLPVTSLLAAVTTYVLLGFDLTKAVSQVLSSVSVKGRYHSLFYEQTQCILDVAHNEQAACYLAGRLSRDSRVVHPVAIAGTMSDKALKDIFAPMVSIIDRWFLVRPDTPRASSLEHQRHVLVELGVDNDHIIDVGAITAKNMQACLSGVEAAVIFGSFYTVGEFLDLADHKKYS